MGGNRQVISTDQAPGAIGPYSQAIGSGEFVFVSGSIGKDPASGEMVEGGVPAQTRRVLENIAAVLEAAGASLQSVVKTTVFLEDMDEFGAMNEVYATFFPEGPPARSTIGVNRLPGGAQVEIEAIARVESGAGGGG